MRDEKKNSNWLSYLMVATIVTILIIVSFTLIRDFRTVQEKDETLPAVGSMALVDPVLNQSNGVQITGFKPGKKVTVKTTFNIDEAIAQQKAKLEEYRRNKGN
jgi:hypothetical protein